MKNILDSLFRCQKISFILPLVTASILYASYAVFGPAENKLYSLIVTLVVSVACFFGAFLVLYFQIKNDTPLWFLNLVEFLAVMVFGTASVVGIVSFFASGLDMSPIGICAAPVLLSAISLAHSKRM